MSETSSARVWWPERGDRGPRHELRPGERLTVGRTGTLLVGADDRGVSRLAGTVAVTPAGWHIELTNANGGAVHPWALPASCARVTTLAWPRIAVRIEGRDASHWVVLESPHHALPVPEDDEERESSTRRTGRPLPLTPTQQQVLRSFFRPVLAWPPAPGPPRQLKNVARELGISESAVQNTLGRAREKALRLGLSSSAGLTHPDYVTVLVQTGYLRPEQN